MRPALEIPETPRRRRRAPFLLSACLVLGTFAMGDRWASSYALSDLYAHPLFLVRDGQSVPVWLPRSLEETQPAGTARPVGGAAVTFGQTYLFETPDGTRIFCEHKLTWMWCDGGWRAERAQTLP